MRYIIPFLLTALFDLTGCGVMTSSSDVPTLTKSSATALAARYYNTCNESTILGQCQLLDIYGNLASTTLDSAFKPYVKAVMQPQPDAGSIAQPDSKELVLTKLGAAIAVDTFARAHGIPASDGMEADDVSWRVVNVIVLQSRLAVDGDRATLTAKLHLIPTAMLPVLRRQNKAAALKLASNQNPRATLHYKYDFNSMGVLEWQVVNE